MKNKYVVEVVLTVSSDDGLKPLTFKQIGAAVRDNVALPYQLLIRGYGLDKVTVRSVDND